MVKVLLAKQIEKKTAVSKQFTGLADSEIKDERVKIYTKHDSATLERIEEVGKNHLYGFILFMVCILSKE